MMKLVTDLLRTGTADRGRPERRGSEDKIQDQRERYGVSPHLGSVRRVRPDVRVAAMIHIRLFSFFEGFFVLRAVPLNIQANNMGAPQCPRFDLHPMRTCEG